ncbi:MAG: HEPN domain-containing protein [Candidatus Omnitrophica bacterium]|nr:HEPN domain-containing protein [Candidatus Omnitrophota bacterium]
MSAPPEILSLVRQWVDKAEEDLRNAEHTLTLEEDCPYGTVCFHAQQCAEKYLKTLLTLHAVPFPKIHDLLELLPLVPKTVHLGFQSSDLGVVNRYVIEGRYPGDWEPITRQDAEEAVAVARKVREAVRKHLPGAALDG